MTRLLTLVLYLFAGQSAQSDPFIGEWRENPVKGKTSIPNEITVEVKGSTVHVTRVRGSFVAELDGVKRPLRDGVEVWSEPYRNGWIIKLEQNGKLASQSFYVLAPNDTLVNTSIRYTLAGEQKITQTFDRIGVGQGINGRWMPRLDVPEKPDVLRITADSRSSLTITYTDGRAIPNEAVDGLTHSLKATGPSAMIDQVSNRRIDERTIERIASKDGKPRFRSRLEVDATRTILTRTDEMFLGEPNAVTVTTVYERQ